MDDNCTDEIKIERITNHSQDHKEKGDCNNCSPFLNCGTCSGFVFTSLQLDIIEIPFQKDKSVTVYKSRFSNTFFNEFWQPPKNKLMLKLVANPLALSGILYH